MTQDPHQHPDGSHQQPPFGPLPSAPPPQQQSIWRLLSMWLAGILQGRTQRRRHVPTQPGYHPPQQGQYPPQGQYPQQHAQHAGQQQHAGHQQHGKKRKKKRDGGDGGDGGDGCDPCGDCDCGIPCFDLMFVLLPLLRLAAPSRPAASGALASGALASGAARAGLAAIRGYQRHISARLPTRCRYTPTCSEYGAQAVGRYGLLVGSRLIAERIQRCTKGVSHGTPDPLR